MDGRESGKGDTQGRGSGAHIVGGITEEVMRTVKAT